VPFVALLLALAAAVPGQAVALDPDPGPPSAPDTGDLPGADDLPRTPISGDAGVLTLTQTTAVRAAKTFVSITQDSPAWAVAYPFEFNTPTEDPTRYVPCNSRRPGRIPCPSWPLAQPDCATADPATQAHAQMYTTGPIYPLTPLSGGGADVGKIAEITVQLAAFGAVPASATLTLRTPRVDGRVQPLTLNYWMYNNPTGVGATGCDPTFLGGETVETALVEGKAEVTVRDLVVDGVPVDLGPTCRTERPLDLALWADNSEAPYKVLYGGTLGAWDGLASPTALPLYNPMYKSRNGTVLSPSTGVTIPPFTGCEANGEDLSALLTAVASGPNNPIRIEQGRPVFRHADGTVPDVGNLGRCGTTVIDGEPVEKCPLPAPDTAEPPPLPDGETP